MSLLIAFRPAIFTLLWTAIFASSDLSQGDSNLAGKRAENNAPGLVIVIFSPEVDSSRRTAMQGAVWNSFIATLKKKNLKTLEVINEVAVNESADRARAVELARAEQERFTVWLQFSPQSPSADNGHIGSSDSDRLVAKYIVFPPQSSAILAQGEIEQERVPESRYQTANNEKAITDNSGRVVNSRPVRRLPDGSLSNGPQTLDIDALKRVGELVAERVVSSIRKLKTSKIP